jgi:RNA polymerase sigma-70 factor (ECF subfamily)
MASGRDLTEERNARFLSLLRPVQHDCERWAYRLTGNTVDAEDILSQAIVFALTKFSQLRDEGKFKWWMFSIIRTTHNLALRAGRRLPEPTAPEEFSQQPGSGPEFTQQDERSRAVRQALAQLSPEQAQALWLFEAEGFSSQEVSTILGKNDGAVRVLLKRARERLRGLLDKAGVLPQE